MLKCHTMAMGVTQFMLCSVYLESCVTFAQTRILFIEINEFSMYLSYGGFFTKIKLSFIFQEIKKHLFGCASA